MFQLASIRLPWSISTLVSPTLRSKFKNRCLVPHCPGSFLARSTLRTILFVIGNHKSVERRPLKDAKCQTYSKSLLTSMPLVTCTCSHFQTWFASFRSIELAVVVFLQPAATNPRRYCAAMSVVISIITHRFGGCCRHNGGRIQRESSELLSRQQEDILVAARHQSKIFGKRRTANPSPPIHLHS